MGCDCRCWLEWRTDVAVDGMWLLMMVGVAERCCCRCWLEWRTDVAVDAGWSCGQMWL
ncbi:hypothetical protein DPMN_042065 [Dreissena polymorpha]|uniref:Uncharacterized protein n=1 Tax=Dreissena polymorpha TaxID=45954 RepID=A0A9D4D041_DREPO|nr:hypothetical protein DPMN_042065 [Dreissena polymorpha]